MSEVSQKGVPTNDPKNIHDMTAFVQQTLTDMQNKFTNMSDQVRHFWPINSQISAQKLITKKKMMGRMDAMSSKLDDLEKSMLAMMDQAEED